MLTRAGVVEYVVSSTHTNDPTFTPPVPVGYIPSLPKTETWGLAEAKSPCHPWAIPIFTFA
ncbi:hypothetical protein [Commensalibacter sp. Nvir]|uniref:hypothetical protein n=1 Tax=Commensalibacter sp. Nvir TaxID=3069817 RepID=UPI0030C7AD9A